MLFFLLWVAACARDGPPGFEARVGAMRAVERARSTIARDSPAASDEAYDHGASAKRVAREVREESVLAERFGIRVSPEMLAAEFERIEKRTQDPQQWEDVKRALQGDRGRIEEVICRPLVVRRLLRQRFAFDESIHAEAHMKARQARSLFLRGQPVEGAKVLRLARAAEPPADTRAWLTEAKAQARGPRVLSVSEDRQEPRPGRPGPLHPEAARALEAQLRRPGDVSTVLSEWDRFAVYRLREATDVAWTVEAAIFPKRDFESWFREQRDVVP